MTALPQFENVLELTEEENGMSEEARYKADMAIKDIDKLRSELHKVQVELAAFCQKLTDQNEFISEKIASINKNVESIQQKVEEMREENIHNKGFAQAIKSIFLKHPIVTQLILFGALVLISPGFIKAHFLG